MSAVPHSVPAVVVREYHSGANYDTVPALTDQAIHVWRQHLDRAASEIPAFRNLLSADELERAGRFRYDRDREECIISRGTLRRLLGAYLNAPAATLRFTYSEYGQPSLEGDRGEGKLEFNVSHSGTIALFAFARDRRIGIDVEKVRRDFSTLEIAERFFSESERTSLRALPSEQRYKAFFSCWTRKEAFIKALGEGLSHPLDQFDVSLLPDAPAALLATDPDSAEASRWWLWDLEVPDDHIAALAAEIDPRAH